MRRAEMLRISMLCVLQGKRINGEHSAFEMYTIPFRGRGAEMKRYKYLFLLVVFVVFVVGIFILVNKNRSIGTDTGTTNDGLKEKTSDYILTTDKGDKFRIVIWQMLQADVDIYYCDGKKQTFLMNVKYYPGLKLLKLLDESSHYRSYDIYGLHALVVDKKSNTCLDIPYEFLDGIRPGRTESPAVYTYFFHVAQEKINTREWLWFVSYAGFLVTNHDQPTIRMVKRYAKGDFTIEELAINSDDSPHASFSPIYKEEAVDKAAALVKSHGL